MFKLLLLFLFTVVCHGDEEYGRPLISGRIVGGTLTTITSHPYQVSVRITSTGTHRCGGAIISTQWVITAAHCTNLYVASQLSVRAGSNSHSSGGTTYSIQTLVNHPSFSSSRMTNDISLLRIIGIFSISSSIQPIALIRSGLDTAAGTIATISGWGSTVVNGPLSSQLMRIDIPVVSQSLCDAIYGGITDTVLCAGYTAGGRDVCQGDYGGPLVANGELIGIASWGDGCARPGHPSVYTKVSRFRTWIESIAGV